jgi:2-hydroxychromene-2-carboxylate isomerase
VERALRTGVCGAPFFVVDDEPFWGVDRLPQLERWLQARF